MKVTAQDVAQLLVSPPPRQVPVHVVRAAQGGSATWFAPLLGLAFFSFGLVFAAIFFPWRFIDDWRLSSDHARSVKGSIVSVRDAKMRINKVPVWDYEFIYNVGDGRQRNGHCYTTGQHWSAPSEVPVRYLATQPDLACLEGARLSKAGGTGVLIITFPLVGAGIAVSFFVSRRNTRRLLVSGQVREVDVISVNRTSTRVNNQYVYKITVTSPNSLSGPSLVVRRTNPNEVDLAQKRVSARQSIYIFHDPLNPKRLLFPEALIGR